jgi:glycosyltransferase involved in cell wall biosynthesis
MHEVTVREPKPKSPPAVRTAEVSVVIPAYNEASLIARSLATLLESLGARHALEIIVVDDGSGDQTAAIVAQEAAREPRIRLIRQPRNQGKGAAVRAGMLAASGESLCFIDADVPLSMAQLESMLDRLAEADLVIASRDSGGASRGAQRPIRTMASRLFHHVVQRLFGLPFADTQCGVKCFRRTAARELFRRMRSNGFAFDVELLLLAQTLGYAVAEVPVHIEQDGLSSVRIAAHSLPVLGELWGIYRRVASKPASSR